MKNKEYTMPLTDKKYNMVSQELCDKWNKLLNIVEQGKSFEGGRWIRYPHYELREEMKSVGWKIIKECIEKKDYYKAAWFLMEVIIYCHYWRAREKLEALEEKEYIKWMKKIRGRKYYKFYRIDIDHYTEHWLWANGDREELFPKQVMDELEEHFDYKPKKCKYLPKGYSLYREPNHIGSPWSDINNN